MTNKSGNITYHNGMITDVIADEGKNCQKQTNVLQILRKHTGNLRMYNECIEDKLRTHCEHYGSIAYV